MDDEILYQGPGYVIARTNRAETAVPYCPATRHNGDVNFGWIDLRGRPDRVVEVPEARSSAGLAEILTVISHPASKIMTSACACAAFDRGQATDGPRWQVGGFIEVMFNDPELNSEPQKLVDLAGGLLNKIGGSTKHHVGYEMIIEPLKLFFGRDDCYGLMIKAVGYGIIESEAWASFEHGTKGIARAIEILRV